MARTGRSRRAPAAGRAAAAAAGARSPHDLSPAERGARQRRAAARGDRQLAVLEMQASMRDACREALAMGRDDDRRAVAVQLLEEAEQALGDRVVDIAGRLVGDEEIGPAD